MKVLKTLALSVGVLGSAYAQTSTSTTTTKKTTTTTTSPSTQATTVGSVTAPSPVSVKALWNAELPADKNQKGMYNALEAQAGYNIDANQDLRLYPSLRISNSKENSSESRQVFQSLEGRYRFKNILTQEANGLAGMIDIRPVYIPGAFDRNAKNQYGYLRNQIVLSKKFSDSFSIDTVLRYDQIAMKGGNNTKSRNEQRVYVTPTYAFSDSFSAQLMFMYRHKNINRSKKDLTTSGKHENSDTLMIEPGVAYKVNENLEIDLYVDLNVLASGSNTGTAGLTKDWAKGATFGSNVIVTAF